MNTPSFTAEASLYKASGHYHMAGAYHQIAKGILPGLATRPTEEAVPFSVTSLFSGCIWGNWCGLNCGSGTTTDVLDKCCKAHDLCYGTSGPYGPCSCDLKLIACAAPKIAQFWHPERAAAALAIVSLFTTKVSSGLCNPLGVERVGEKEGGGGGGGGGGIHQQK